MRVGLARMAALHQTTTNFGMQLVLYRCRERDLLSVRQRPSVSFAQLGNGYRRWRRSVRIAHARQYLTGERPQGRNRFTRCGVTGLMAACLT